MKKYIVDNLSSQSITGQLTIDGGLTASDMTINGVLTVNGGSASSFDDMIINGGLNVNGGLTASDIKINGGLIVNGGLTASDIKINGGLIVNGGLTASDATIDGSLVVKGGLTVVDAENFTTLTYRALLTQTAIIGATSISGLGDAFIVGEQYTITDYQDGDDFNNIGIYATGSPFMATGEIPNNWTNGSTITSGGILVANVLENTLGYDLGWQRVQDQNSPLPVPGYYMAFPNNIGPKYNNFPRNRTSVIIQEGFVKDGDIFQGSDSIRYYPSYANLSSKDDVILVRTWNINFQSPTQSEYVSDNLYLTPIEIKIRQNNDTTPIKISGSIPYNDFPFSPEYLDLYCNNSSTSIFIDYFLGVSEEVNDITELVDALNNGYETPFLGVFSEDGLGGIELNMPTNLVERFALNGTLTFEVY